MKTLLFQMISTILIVICMVFTFLYFSIIFTILFERWIVCIIL